MALVLIVDDETNFPEKMLNILTKNYQFEALVKNGASDIISFVEIMGSVDAIITPEKTKKEFISEKLAKYLIANSSQYEDKIKLIVLGKNEINYVSKYQLDPKSSPEKVAHTCNMLISPNESIQKDNLKKRKELLTGNTLTTDVTSTSFFQLPKSFKSQTNKHNKVESDQSYVGINVYYFYSVKDLPAKFNYYACVKKGVSVEYQLKFEKGTIIPKSEVDKLFQGFAPKLYVVHSEYYDAIVSLTKSFLSNFTFPITSNETKLNLNKNCYHILCHLFSSHNVDQLTLDLMKHGLKHFESLTNCEGAIDLFKDIIYAETKFDYSYLHAHLTCVLLYQYIDSFEWSKNFTKNKLLYFAYFHDLSLGSHRLIKIHHNYQENINKISEAENKLILEHADMTARTLESVINVPKEFVALIREHHGVVNGQGFSTQLNPRFSPLSKMIIVIESFVTLYLNEFSQKQYMNLEDIKAITANLIDRFNKPGYLEVATELDRHAISLATIYKTRNG